MYPLPRPHLKQRLVARVLNLGVFLDLAMTDVFAIKIKSFEKLVEIAYQAKAPMSNVRLNTRSLTIKLFLERKAHMFEEFLNLRL